MSITTLFGQDGIITKAQEAGRKTAEAAQNEQEFLNYAQDYLNNYLSGAPKTELEQKMADAGITGDPESLKDVVDGVPIPKGFTVSTVTGEKTKAEGLVIKDDNLNEFVWVPVKDLTADGTIDGTNYNQKFGRRTFGRSDTLGGTATNSGKFSENIDPLVITSVEQYGGFYIARYEASYNNGKVASKPSTTVSVYEWINTNGRLWNCIEQASSAVIICSNMYTSDAKVKAHLPYGAEWDSTLQWFKQTAPGFNNENTLIGSNSTSWGNYSNASFTYGPSSTLKPSGTATLINTGATDYTKVNNIYDMAGNLFEWTQEEHPFGSTLRAERGGSYFAGGAVLPAAYRHDNDTHFEGYIGFRPALYIK